MHFIGLKQKRWKAHFRVSPFEVTELPLTSNKVVYTSTLADSGTKHMPSFTLQSNALRAKTSPLSTKASILAL